MPQTTTTPLPLGCWRCEECGRVSSVYALETICRDCSASVCAECYVPNSLKETDGKLSVLCEVCEETADDL